MNVRELIAELQKVDPDLPVYVMESDGTPSCNNECCWYSYSGGAEYSEASSVSEDTEVRGGWPSTGPITSFQSVRITVY